MPARYRSHGIGGTAYPSTSPFRAPFPSLRGSHERRRWLFLCFRGLAAFPLHLHYDGSTASLSHRDLILGSPPLPPIRLFGIALKFAVDQSHFRERVLRSFLQAGESLQSFHHFLASCLTDRLSVKSAGR